MALQGGEGIGGGDWAYLYRDGGVKDVALQGGEGMGGGDRAYLYRDGGVKEGALQGREGIGGGDRAYLYRDGGGSEAEERGALQLHLHPALDEDDALHDGAVQRVVQQHLLSLPQEHLATRRRRTGEKQRTGENPESPMHETVNSLDQPGKYETIPACTTGIRAVGTTNDRRYENYFHVFKTATPNVRNFNLSVL